MSRSFFKFGIQLWEARKSAGLSPDEVAVKLGISKADYKKFESGLSCPSPDVLSLISATFGLDISDLPTTPISQKPASPAQPPVLSHLPPSRFETEWDRIMKEVLRVKSPDPEDATIIWKLLLNESHAEALASLKKLSLNFFIPPVLPMNLLIIFLAIENKRHGYTYLHEFKSPFSNQESLADYISYDPHATFLFYAANLTCFADSPAVDILGCLNRLTILQFNELLFLILSSRGVYDNLTVIPFLEEQMEFARRGAFLARRLAPHLKDQVNPSHLHMAILLQNLGEYALLTLLFKGGENPPHDPHISLFPDDYQSKRDIIYSLHPLVSAALGARLGFPEEVVNAVLNHHLQPASTVTPLCAGVKLADKLTDQQFFFSFRGNLNALVESVLAETPQLKLNPKTLLQVLDELKQYKNSLFELSSSLLEDTSKTVHDYAHTQRSNKLEREKILATKGTGLFDPIRKDFRFDKSYQEALLLECQAQVSQFRDTFLSPGFSESPGDFEKRMVSIFAKLAAIHNQDPHLLSKHVRNAFRSFTSSV